MRLSIRRVSALTALVASLSLAGCASGPMFEAKGIDAALTPARVAKDGAVPQGAQVIWGGSIIASTNLEKGTQIEVLGYSLDGTQRPRVEEPPLGRFLILYPDYLETVDYAAGRLVTVKGRVASVREGQVGESHYRYPVVAPDSNGLYLWPKESQSSEPKVHFGIGIGIVR